MSDVKNLLKDLEKKFKEKIGVIGVPLEDAHRLRSNIFAFDLATGGGIPMGRISIIYGPESSMKTSLCLKLIAQAQKEFPDKTAVFVDVEGRFNAMWASKMGVDVETLAYVLPDNAEQAVDSIESLMYADDLSVIVIDSLAALTTTHELDSSAEKAMVGTQGILINKLYRKISRALTLARREGTAPTLIAINQIRSKVGVMYGNPEVMPGGHAFKFASSMTVRIYGKDEYKKDIHEVLPVYKLIKFVIKKYSVPIVSPSGEFLLSLVPVPQYDLTIGESYDWNTVVSYLKSLEFLVKGDKGWDLVWPDTGEVEHYSKQDEIKNLAMNDDEFGARLRKCIVDAVVESDA